ncbi:MAG TPA: serine hydrolase [Pyrinomonadaceae bacterium]|jgi:CubicO group peptidase (beta-lactamase class C family)
MTLKRFSHLAIVLVLLAANLLSPLPGTAFAQATVQGGGPASPTAAGQATDLAARLAAIEKALEEKRREYHIPGMSLVIVKDDKVIYMKGFGVRDVARGLPATPDTLFAIGSSTKAFTAMAAAMTVDEGKFSFDDPPAKMLPYFKLRDPEANAKITIRDLLSHRSGLDRTDLSMVSGQLTREELIRIAGLAKPTAKLGERFLYQNIMFTAAGEIVARAQHTTWDRFIRERIFKPLGMRSSNTTIAEMLKAPDYALGYNYNSATLETTQIPMREIGPSAPAGAINSNARDMAQWLRLMLGGGVFEGKRLVSEKSFEELLKKQHTVASNIGYGLGWFLRSWEGHKVVEHGGNIDGFNAEVGLMPDQRLGFVLLTNVSASPITPVAMETIWSNLVQRERMNVAPNANVAANASAGDLSREVGRYLLAEANVTFEVELKDGKLTLSVPGQPLYVLENMGGRRYRLGPPAPAGFFVTFRPAKENETETEMYLEQPQGNFVVRRIKPETAAGSDMAAKPDATTAASDAAGTLRELLGSYDMKGAGPTVEVKMIDGKIVLFVPGQPPYPLAEREKDRFYSPLLPDTYSFTARRDADGKVIGITIKQPEGEFPLNRVAAFVAPLTAEELMTKVIAAAGGEANLRKHKSKLMTLDLNFEHQGLTATETFRAKAPAAEMTSIKLMGLGRQIGTIDDYFDGTAGVQIASFAPPEVKAGKSLADARIAADFYGPLNWQKLFRSVVIKRMAKLGEEEVYVVEKTPEKGNPVTDYISVKSFLLLRRDTIQTNNTNDMSLPVKETYDDYRLVDGVMVPFKIVTSIPTIGDIVSTVKTVQFDVELPDTLFRPEAKKR